MNKFFHNSLLEADPDIHNIIQEELHRQRYNIELIASENIVSKAVLEAQGSILTNKYAEGYCGNRYYGGCEYVDKIESLAIERAKKLFNVKYVNVQPHSGSQANQAVFFALIKPDDTILGMALDCGGHLTHGCHVNQSGKWFNATHYYVHRDNGIVDYDEIAKIAKENKPKLLIAGCSAYPRELDFKKFREIADSIGAYLMVDMAHFAGLVATGMYNDPIPYAHVVTTTTHKTLRGARGGMIMTNHEEISKAINKAIFPGIQGGPLMHVIAGKAVAFGEALNDKYKEYIKMVIKNAKIMCEVLKDRKYDIFTDGTDCHLALVDLRKHNITGKDSEKSLENAMLTCNKNAIPFDTAKPTVTSGIRIGSPAGTTRGLGENEFAIIANLIADVLDGLKKNGNNGGNNEIERNVANKIKDICDKFPIY